ncbi:hypothetical protein ACP70R_033427 [Stipagrostis hirtigluma subsp. patula]
MAMAVPAPRSLLLAVVLVLAAAATGAATTLTLHNLCPYPVWPLVTPNTGFPAISDNAARLDGGGRGLVSYRFPASFWAGRVVARTGCAAAAPAPSRCETGRPFRTRDGNDQTNSRSSSLLLPIYVAASRAAKTEIEGKIEQEDDGGGVGKGTPRWPFRRLAPSCDLPPESTRGCHGTLGARDALRAEALSAAKPSRDATFTSKRSYHGDPYDGIGTLPFQMFGLVMAISGTLTIREIYLSLRDEEQEQRTKEEVEQRIKKEQEHRMHIAKALGRSE